VNTSLTKEDAGTPLRPAAATLKQLVRRSVDLRQLYGHAARACEPGMRLVLNENVQTLALLISDLQARLREMGVKPPLQGSLRGTTHRHLAGWLMHASPRSELAWLRLLAHHETALLLGFEQAITDTTAATAQVLRQQLPRLRGIQLDMHTLAGPAGY
jgi:uncharacterized protein (TIGR02284 family)